MRGVVSHVMRGGVSCNEGWSRVSCSEGWSVM